MLTGRVLASLALLVAIAGSTSGCFAIEYHRASKRVARRFDGFPPRFADPTLASYRERFLVDRRRVLAARDDFFEDRSLAPCEPSEAITRRLVDPLGAADPMQERRDVEARDVRISRIEGPCPDADARWMRFRLSYRVVPRDEHHAPVSVVRIVEGTFRDGFVEGRFLVFERERALIDERTYDVLLLGYGAMNGERGEVLEPTAFFRFERPGVRNHTRASLPLGDGRHRDYIYQGDTLTTTAEWKGFALDGDVVRSAYRNANGVLMPEERERYRDGVRIDEPAGAP